VVHDALIAFMAATAQVQAEALMVRATAMINPNALHSDSSQTSQARSDNDCAHARARRVKNNAASCSMMWAVFHKGFDMRPSKAAILSDIDRVRSRAGSWLRFHTKSTTLWQAFTILAFWRDTSGLISSHNPMSFDRKLKFFITSSFAKLRLRLGSSCNSISLCMMATSLAAPPLSSGQAGRRSGISTARRRIVRD